MPLESSFVGLPVESRRAIEEWCSKFEWRSCDCYGPYEYCPECKPGPLKIDPPGKGIYKKTDDPTVRLVSMKAVEFFNRRNKDRNLKLKEVVKARFSYNLKHIYNLDLLATEEENVEGKGPCTRSQTALKEKKAKAGRKRRLPRTVHLGALVTVALNKSKTIKVHVAVEEPN